ncbi:hypothetical protein Tco_0464809, partial [Tanacetum coccineum]
IMLRDRAFGGFVVDVVAAIDQGGPPDHMRASEKELVVLKSPLEQKSMFRRQERMLRRQEQQRLVKDAKIQRRIWDPGIKRARTRLKWCYYPDTTQTGSYQLVLSLRALVERVSNLRVLFMASGDSCQDAEDALSKLLQMGTVAEYQKDFEMLINRVTEISKSLLTSERERDINKKKGDTILSLQHKLASPEYKGSLDADEYIRVDEFSSAIDYVIHTGESNEVRSKKSRAATEDERRALCYVQDRERRKKKKMEAEIQRRLWDPGIKIIFRQHLEDNVVSEGVGSVTTAKSRITIK